MNTTCPLCGEPAQATEVKTWAGTVQVVDCQVLCALSPHPPANDYDDRVKYGRRWAQRGAQR